MLNTFSRRLILSHLIPVLLVIPLMGFAFEFLLGTHVVSSNPGSEVAGTLCAHFQTLAVPFAGVMVFGLLFGSAVAWYLARVTDRPVQKIIQNIVHMSTEKSSSPLQEDGPQEIQALVRSVNLLAQRRFDAEEAYQSFGERSLSLSQWLPQTLENWRGAAKARRLYWDAIIPASLPAVRIDPDRLQPVMNCLLGSAIQSAPPGGRITVHVKMVGEALSIAIGDKSNNDQDNPCTNPALDNVIDSADVQRKASASQIRLFIEKDTESRNTFMLLFPLNGS